MMMQAIVVFIISMILSSMFITLLERKIMSSGHIRQSPNIRFWGIVQPVLDGMKLLLIKEHSDKKKFSVILWKYTMSMTAMLLLLNLVNSLSLPINPYILTSSYYSIVFVVCISSMMMIVHFSYSLMGKSKFTWMSMIRAIGTTLTWEINLLNLLYLMMTMLSSMSMKMGLVNVTWSWKTNMLFSLSLIMITVGIMSGELNRSPFDFMESESETGSGNSTEFGSSSFTFVFLSEYMHLLFFGLMVFHLFSYQYSYNLLILFMLMVAQLVLLLPRVVFIRMKWQNLMIVSWISMVPVTIIMTVFGGFLNIFA